MARKVRVVDAQEMFHRSYKESDEQAQRKLLMQVDLYRPVKKRRKRARANRAVKIASSDVKKLYTEREARYEALKKAHKAFKKSPIYRETIMAIPSHIEIVTKPALNIGDVIEVSIFGIIKTYTIRSKKDAKAFAMSNYKKIK